MNGVKKCERANQSAQARRKKSKRDAKELVRKVPMNIEVGRDCGMIFDVVGHCLYFWLREGLV